jgi:hypothetical protein
MNLLKRLFERDLPDAEVANHFGVAGFQATRFDAILQLLQGHLGHAAVFGL